MGKGALGVRKIWIPMLVWIAAAGVLLGVYNGLLGVRKVNAERELQAKMETLLPGSKTFVTEPYDGEDANITCVYKGETGYVVGTTVAGYAGDIVMLIGVSTEGTVTGLQVRQMQETFGLGGKALTDWVFLAQFLHTDGSAEVGNDIDAIAGATVTSNAIARSVRSAVAVVTGTDVDTSATV